jgi:hypothetical protein
MVDSRWQIAPAYRRQGLKNLKSDYLDFLDIGVWNLFGILKMRIK